MKRKLLGIILAGTMILTSAMPVVAQEVTDTIFVPTSETTKEIDVETTESITTEGTINTDDVVVEEIQTIDEKDIVVENEEEIAVVDDDELVGNGATIELSSDIYGDYTMNNNDRVILTKNITINGNFNISGDMYALDLNGHKLTVTGNMIAKKDVNVNGGYLVVKGDYVQCSGSLGVGGNNAEAKIDGNLRLQGWSEAKEEYGDGSGRISVYKPISVGKNVYVNSTGSCYIAGDVTMTIGGNLYDMSGSFRGSDGAVVFTAVEPIIEAPSQGTSLGDVKFENKKAKVKGYLTFDYLLSDVAITPIGENITFVYNSNNGRNNINGKKLTINGNLIVELGNSVNGRWVYGDFVIEGGKLNVNGDVLHKSGVIGLRGAAPEINVTGNYRMQGFNADNEYATGTGDVFFDSSASSGKITIGKNLYVNASSEFNGGSGTFGSNRGTLIIGGNLYDDNASFYSTYNGNSMSVIFNADYPEIHTTTPNGINLGNVTFTNGKAKTKGKVGIASLAKDATITPLDEKMSITDINLNGKKLTINGNAYCTGNVSGLTTASVFKVTGDYMQAAGSLKVGDGQVDISKNLYVKALDDEKNYVTGSGSIEMESISGRLNVGGELQYQSTASSYLDEGIMTVYGDITQSIAGGADGIIKGKEKHTTILPGDKKQVVKFENADCTFGTLQLSKAKSNYTFNPEPCWIKLVCWNFKDVTEKDWYFAAVKYAYENGIMKGMDAEGTIFNPKQACTREQVLQILYSSDGAPSVYGSNPFRDVISGKWYYNAVIWGVKQNITSGRSATEFGTGGKVTRQEMALFLMKYASNKGYDTSARANLNGFSDLGTVSSWAMQAIQWANASGIINGKGSGSNLRIDPKATTSRAEVAQMVMGFQNKFGK